ncbi:MAG: ABC transporter permease [Brevinema sp.]
MKIKITNEIRILFCIVVISLVAGIFNLSFFSWDNWSLFLRINSGIGIISFGMLLIILTGGIDVSVAANIAIMASISAILSEQFAPNMFILFLVVCILGGLFGAVNGFLITYCQITPIIITLSTLNIGNGILLYFTRGTWFNKFASNYIYFSDIIFLGIPIQIIFYGIVALITFFLLKYTLIGRTIYAIGGNIEAAERQGLPVKFVKIFVYAYTGVLCGVAAIIYSSISKQVSPTAFLGFELTVISVVILGGASILGGYGSVYGNILGWILLAVINNAIILMRVPVYWQNIVLSVIIIMVVVINIVLEQRKKDSIPKIDLDENYE